MSPTKILGGGTFSSRLYSAVRENGGLAYSVGTGLLPYDHAGAFIAATSVDAANGQARRSTSCSTRSAASPSDGPTEAELASAKDDLLLGNFALRFDLSQKIARNLLQFPARRSRHRLHRAAQLS